MEILRFDFEAVFEPEDYLYFYGDILTEEQTKKEVEFLVKELELYNPTEIVNLLTRVGLQIYKMYGDWEAKPFTNDSRRMLIIARKEIRKK